MSQPLVDDEAHERLPVHHQSFFGRFCDKIRFRLARECGVVAEQPLVIIGIHQHRVERGGILLARAHHLLAAHLLLRLFGDLNR